jgi:hypothetical protein
MARPYADRAPDLSASKSSFWSHEIGRELRQRDLLRGRNCVRIGRSRSLNGLDPLLDRRDIEILRFGRSAAATGS